MDIIFFGFFFAVALAFYALGFFFKNRLFVLAGGVFILLLGFFLVGLDLSYQQVDSTTTSYGDTYWAYTEDTVNCTGDVFQSCEHDLNQTYNGNYTVANTYADYTLTTDNSYATSAFGLLLILIGFYSLISSVFEEWKERRSPAY